MIKSTVILIEIELVMERDGIGSLLIKDEVRFAIHSGISRVVLAAIREIQ